jgi:hypothetical protein
MSDTYTGSDGMIHRHVRKRNGGRMVNRGDYDSRCSCCFLNLSHDMATHKESIGNDDGPVHNMAELSQP